MNCPHIGQIVFKLVIGLFIHLLVPLFIHSIIFYFLGKISKTKFILYMAFVFLNEYRWIESNNVAVTL